METATLWCPIPKFINARWTSWEAQTAEWVHAFKLESEQRDRGRLRSIAAGELAGRTVLTANRLDGGQFASDSLMWLFAFDDAYCDEGRYSHSPAEMAILVADMVRIAETGRTSSVSPVALALADLRTRLESLATPAQIARWVNALRGYLGYQVWEAAYRSTGRIPSLDEYSVARIRNGSMELCAATIPIADGYVVRDDELERHDVRALTEIACSLVGWDNDIASYRKEHERTGDELNFLDVTAHEFGVSVTEALRLVLGYRDAALDLFLRLQRQTAQVVAPETARYVDGLAAWIRGNLDWSVGTARYRGQAQATIAVTGELGHHIHRPHLGDGVSWWWDQLSQQGADLGEDQADDRDADRARA